MNIYGWIEDKTDDRITKALEVNDAYGGWGLDAIMNNNPVDDLLWEIDELLYSQLRENTHMSPSRYRRK